MSDENTVMPDDEPVVPVDGDEGAVSAELADDPSLTGQLRALEEEFPLESPISDAGPSEVWESSQDEATDELSTEEPVAEATVVDTPWGDAPADGHVDAFGDIVPEDVFAAELLPVEDALADQAEATGVFAPLEAGIDLGPERRSRWWIWAAAAVVVLAIAGGAAYGYWWFTSRPLTVPDVMGRQPAEATQILNDAGLRLGAVSEVPTDAPAGTIVAQDPGPDKTLKPDSKVSIVVAVASEFTDVPDVAGTELVAAQGELARFRLRAEVIESHSTTVAAGYVISQLPSAGVELEPGSFVALVVSKGAAPANISVPKLTGMSDADAARFVESLGLIPATYRSVDASVSSGQVVGQSPAAAASVARGTVVQILASQGAGSNPVAPPDVVGKLQADAVKKLESKKFKVEVKDSYSSTVPKGQVISQMPSANAKMASGGTVGLVISKGSPSAGVVPSVVGTASVDATKSINAAGFTPIVLVLPIRGADAGTVIMQYPAPGTQYTFGYPLVCLVAEPVKK